MVKPHQRIAGQMLPARSELAKRFGVARATADRAIRSLIEQAE